MWRPREESSATGWRLGHALPTDPDSDRVRGIDGYLGLHPGA
ncbi:hypothetical protein [Streptomyces olivaceus]|nr:hypothetical protein [Streptomyces olivaceus]